LADGKTGEMEEREKDDEDGDEDEAGHSEVCW
jgi:hypothetical protein